jgi:glycosyltransferase involved in cell wall biosynthesis
MELIDFSKNENSITRKAHIESSLLYGDPDNIGNAETTICIPTYKRPQLLKEAIYSAINQDTNIPYIIMIVDNDPDFDKTEILDIIRLYRNGKILYYKNRENLSMAGNWNRCFTLARTRWVTLLHDDDLLSENCIEDIFDVLSKHEKKIKGLCGRIKFMDDIFFQANISGKIKKDKRFFNFLCSLYKLSLGKIVKIPLITNFFTNPYGPPTCGMTFDRNVFIETGGFNEKYHPCSDRVFCIHFSKKYNFYRIRKDIGFYRWAVNESLNIDTIEQSKRMRKIYLLSLKNCNTVCFIFYLILKNRILQNNLE